MSWLPLRKACFRCERLALEVYLNPESRGIAITRFLDARCSGCGIEFVFTAMRPPGYPKELSQEDSAQGESHVPVHGLRSVVHFVSGAV